MKKRMYNAPEITVLEIGVSAMIASSNTFEDQTGGGGSVEFNQTTVSDGDAGSARVASNQYFDSWSDDEE